MSKPRQRFSLSRAAAVAVAVALAWSLLAFGAVYAWSAPPLLAIAAAALLLARARPDVHDLIDAAALAALAVMALQLIPVPAAVRGAMSPAAETYRAAMVLDHDARAWAPLTLDPQRTRDLLMLGAAAFAIYAATRRVASHEGRFIARGIAWIALLGSLIGIGGKMLFPSGRIYGFWSPLEPGAAPFGAVINRNHFAAWAIMAVVIILGALAAELARRERSDVRRAIVAVLAQARVLWLLAAAAVTVAAIVLTASRSGFAGLVAAALTAVVLMRRRASGRAMVAISAAGVICLVAAMTWARPDRLLSRLDVAGSELGLRQTIWTQSLEIARQYPIAGVGAGAFPAAMAYYQTGARDVFYNHAHNQYVELIVDGGALLALPLLLIVIGLIRRIARQLGADRGSTFWVRVGAAAALAGLAVMCIWESPFRTPATLMLAAAAAGLASAEERR